MSNVIAKLRTSIYALLVTLCMCCSLSQSALAVECLDVFPNAHTENGPTFNSFSFPNFNGTTDINRNQNSNFSIVEGNYRNIVVGQNSTVSFTTAHGNYKIKSLQIFNRSSIEFEPGDYWIENLHFGYSNTLKIRSSGTVRIFVKNRFRTFQDNEWNKDENGQLVIYAGELAVDRNNNASNNLPKRLDFTGAIYTEELTFGHNSMRVQGKGSLASANNVNDNKTNLISYNQSVLEETNFQNLCDFIVPVSSQWNLDEVSWSSAESIVDSVGSNHGSPSGGLFPVSTNPVFAGNPGTCNNGSFDGQNNYFEVDNTLGDNFTMMAWIRPAADFLTGSFPYQGDGIFWSDVSGSGNDFLVGGIREGGQNRISFMVGGTGSDLKVTSSAVPLNQWTHVAVTRHRTSGVMSIYLNGVLDNSLTTSNHNILTSNPKIAIGGNPLDGRYFEGNIDEVKFYNATLFANQISQNMNEIRTCPVLGPTVEYRFDNFQSSEVDDVIDSSGNAYHGTAFAVGSSSGLLCGAADFTTPGDANYIVANSNALNGLSDFTAMAWVKTTQTFDATIFSAASANTSLGTNEAVFYFDDANRFWPTITASPFNNVTRLSSTDTVNDGEWHQVVWTREASTEESCFFFDGQAQGCVTHDDNIDNSPISVLTGGLIIGQEQDSLGGGFEVNQSFDGLMDEFMIFDRVLTQVAISDINDNIRTNKNWDGSPRGACPVAFPLLDMRFDETTWSGADAVLDSSGNGLHGTAFGSATPINGMSCNAADLSQVGTADYISVNYKAIDNLLDFSVVFWGKQDSNNSMAALSGAGEGSDNEFLVFFQRNGNASDLRISPYVNGSRTGFDTDFDTDWHQYVWTRKGSSRESCVYRDGVEIDCRTTARGDILDISPGGFVIGQEQDSVAGDDGGSFVSNQAWNGLIDELLIFPKVLSESEINVYRQYTIDNKDWNGIAKSCSTPIDHYRFEIPNTGLTCAASDIVLKACEDATCSSESPLSSSLTLSPSGQWSMGAVINDNVTFTGLTNLQLSQPTAIPTAISASNLNPLPSSSTPVQCFDGSTAVSCSILFKDTGFLFSAIPHQISNKPSSVEFNGQPLTIQAVEKNTTTGACQAIFPNGSDTDIELKLNCVSGACSDIAITTNSSATDASVGTSFSDVPFNFALDSGINNNVANYVLKYANAGELSLSAQKVVTLSSGITATLEGTSNNFVVKPFGFKLLFPDFTGTSVNKPFYNSNLDHTDSVFVKAGENFKLDATAIGWQALGEDANNDGNIDVGQNANDNPVVQFFDGQDVKLTHGLQLPTIGSAGTFTAANTITASSKAAFTNANWNEVGVISLTATLASGSYLTAGNVTGSVENVGRFTPHHFVVSDITAGEFVGTAQCLNQTFIGESTAGALNYGAMRPSMEVTAQYSIVDGTTVTTGTTLNYHGNFKRFDETNITFDLPTQDNVNSLALTAVINAGSVSGGNGVFIYTASATDHFVYTRNTASQVAPFTANINYTALTLADGDGVGLASGAAFPTLSATSSTLPQHLMRYGRVQLNNAFGPENEVLAMPIEHQFFDGTNFIVNPNMGAGCAAPAVLNTKFTLIPTSLGDLDQAALPNASAWGAGHSSLLIPPPNSAQGAVEFTLDVPNWLKFDWDNAAATSDTNPKANATFGRYRGNDRIINWRERR